MGMAPATLVLALAACAAPPPSRPAPAAQVVAPARLDAAAAQGAAQGEGAAALDQWWTAWGDPALDRLVDAALAANTDLRVARAHVEAARALASVAEAALYPTIAAQGAGWGNAGDTGIDGTAGSVLSPFTRGATGGGYLVGLGAQWEPDIFGGRHADVAAAQAMAGGVDWMAQGVRLMVVADVVENYQQWRGLEARLALLDQSLEATRALTTYVAARQGTGQASKPDLTRAQAAAASLEATRPQLLALIDARRRRLAILSGALPEAMVDVVPRRGGSSDLAVPPPPSGQWPSTILERRPDVRASMAMVAARAAKLKSYKADLYPRFSIGFSGQNGELGLSGLPGFGGTMGLLNVKASVPIFTGGLLRGRIAAGQAELEGALAAQDRTVLSSLEEVETAYGLRAGFDARVAGLVSARTLSARRADEAQAFYRAGRVTLGDVLQARLDTLSDADKLEQARIAQRSATVQLYRALGGGWSPPAPGPSVSSAHPAPPALQGSSPR